MILRSCVVFVFALCFAGTLAVSSAHAQARVGEAVLVQNEVLRVSAASTAQINVGDGLLRDETVRTGADSATRLVMADSTNLSLGPNAAIKLDRTVFDDEHTYRDIAVRLTTGAFRFVTGHSEKTAYKISDAAGDDRRARHRARHPVAARPHRRGAAGGRRERLRRSKTRPGIDAKRIAEKKDWIEF